MKRYSFTKWFVFLLIFLLTFTVFMPIITPTSSLPSNKALNSGSLVSHWVSGPPVPQPASSVYLIITPNSAWVQSFAEWKNLKGVPTQVVNVSWIQTNYPLSATVRDKAEQIWTFIEDVYDNASPATLQWVLLIGDNATIPSRYVYLPDTSEWVGQDPNRKPTDFYYSVMDDANWDDDGDGRWGECATFNVGGPLWDEIGDWQPDLYVGRIPFSDQTNITSILSKSMNYARNPTSFSATGWDTFLLGGAISNYDEEAWAWTDGDYTDEAELSDYINANHIPGYYDVYRFYEQHPFYFWDYSPTYPYQNLNATAIQQGIDAFSPALINFGAHGSPTDIQRKYTNLGYPYGGKYSVTAGGFAHNISGVAIGNPDNDGFNEIVYTTGPTNSGTNGTVWFADGTNFWNTGMIWDLWRNPVPGVGPTWATCVDIGDVWNNGTISVVVGTWAGAVIIFTLLPSGWTAYTHPNLQELWDPILCIEVGNADNTQAPPGNTGDNIPNFMQTDIAWGHLSGVVRVATVNGGPPPQVLWAFVSNMNQAVYSIDIGNPNDDGFNEITYGTGYSGGLAWTGDCNMSQHIPGAGFFIHFAVDKNVGGIIYGLDSGDAGNDGFNKVVVGLSTGAIFMYEANKFVGGTDVGTKQVVANHGANQGIVRCLRVGDVDNNDLPSTTLIVEDTSIVVGVALGGIRKYHADNNTGYLDDYPIEKYDLSGFSSTTTAIDLGELSYITSQTEIGSNIEVAAGTNVSLTGLCFVNWYEWPWNLWDNMLNTTQINASTATIPALVYADSCHTAGYDYPQEALAETFIRNMAIGYIGSMRICWYYRGTMSTSFSWGLGRYQSQAFWDLFFSGSTNYRPGATLYQNKIDYQAAFSSIAASFPNTWETYHRKNLISYALFGDPEVDVFTNNPRTLTVTHPTHANFNGDTLFRVMDGTSPVSGATICLWDTDGSYYEILTTNASGYAVATVTASVPNTVNVTVTAHNYIPYENTIGTQHWLDVSRPAISFTAAALTLDITEVTATCSNSTHGSLDDTEATTHTYTIYDDSSGTATTLTGSLSWTGTDWEHLSIDVSSLPLGTYYAICTFADADVSATNSPPSATFTISPIGPPPFNLFEWLAQNWLLILMAIIILILIIVIVLLLRRRKPKEE